MSEVIWSDTARSDLARIDDFLLAVDSRYAERVALQALLAGRFLSQFPSAGAIVDGETRKWTISGTEYILLYEYREDGIDILRVHHGREDWWPR